MREGRRGGDEGRKKRRGEDGNEEGKRERRGREREDETGGKRTSKGGDSKHNITPVQITRQRISGTWHTQTYTYTHPSRVIHSSWWDGVLFTLLHFHLITLAKNSSQLADTHI